MKIRQPGLVILFVCSLLLALGLLLNLNLNVYASESSAAAYNSHTDDLSARDTSRFTELRNTDNITFTPAYTTFLPLVSKPFVSAPPAGIYGRITYQGAPVTNSEVELWRCDYQTTYWSCSSLNVLTTTTDLDGHYQFTGAPSLQVNQKYRVSFSGNDPRYLSWWNSFSIYTYTAGQVIAGGDFDVADITLLAPASGITATLPLLFQWVPRAATSSDSYQVGLVNYDTSEYWYSPQVGYATSYTLINPPPGFTVGTTFAWGVWAIAPDGGSGLSREGHTFIVGSGSIH